MSGLEIIGSVFLLIGAYFIFVGTLGVLRMPDVFNKLQAGTKATTLGFLSIALGAMFIMPHWFWKLIVIAFFVLASNPIGSHALARASKNTGIPHIEKKNEGEE